MRNHELALSAPKQGSAGSAQLSISSASTKTIFCPWCLVTSDQFVKMVFHHEQSSKFYQCPHCKGTMGAD